MAYTEKKGRKAKSEALLERARECFKQVQDAESRQRHREREDLDFQIGENQWTPEARKERQGDGTAPPRPMLSINLIQQPMQLVQNQAASARLGVNLHPVSEEADQDTAEALQGLYRRIERDGGADDARLWAFDRAKQCGRGYYGINSRYDEDADPTGPGAWDQELYYRRFLHQDAVFLDPAHQMPDGSDAEWALIVEWMTKRRFRRLFPKAKAADATADWELMEDEAPEWVNAAASDDEEKGVLVAEYWYKEIEREEIEAPDGRKRSREIVKVYCCKVNGAEVLEEPQEWDGRYIPIIQIVGRELQPVRGERRYEGMTRPAMDGQRLYNYSASTLVERMALEPKTPFIGAEGQFEGYEEQWRQANTRNLPYLQYRPIALGDKPAPPPQRAQIDGSGMSLALMALQEGKGFVQSTTAVFAPSLGEMPDRKEAQSGRAILALQGQSDAGTSHYLNNLAKAMKYEARIMLDLIPHKYDRAGRVTAILTGEDETQSIMLGQPFTKDPRTGRPVPARPGDRNVKTYDLAQAGKYGISVDIGKSFQTALEEGGAMLGEVLAKAPALMPLIGPTYFRYQTWPGAKEVSDILEKVRDKQFPGLGDDEDGLTPEAAQAKVQALEQQLQMMGAQMQAAMKALETDQAKQQAQIMKAQLDAQSRMAETQMEIESKERIAAANNETKLAIEGLAVQLEALLALQAESHERAAQHEQMAHEVAMGAAGGRSMTMSRDQGQTDEQEEGQEMSAGQASERSEQDQPPAQEASE